MSSTNKTSLGLNMWEASDKPVRQDFINDNVIVDEEVCKLKQDIVNGNAAIDEKINKLNINLALKADNSNFVKYNMEYHARINLTSGYISGMINDKISQGYKGGDIALSSYAPPDTYNGNQYGIIKWTLVISDIAYLQFLVPRSSAIVTRAISVSESYDTGWSAQ
ncbi:hypothetical protein [Lacrimispora sp.]|uniref:hypothetical protein n=1 Tax=Lacrimispora sp. TaxID=2719234 RepID=UPI0028A60CC9|nr:hypothetical protein [Lacrimispora sp.]